MPEVPAVVGSSSGPLTEADDARPSRELQDDIKRGEHEQSVKLRNVYAIWTAGVATFQITAMNLFFMFQAIGSIPGTGVTFQATEPIFKFAMWVFASVTAVAFIVVRSLFPGSGGGFWETVLGLFGKKEPIP